MIGRIERGGAAPSFDTLHKLSEVLNTPVRDFFGLGDYVAASGREDPLARLLHRLSSLEPADLDWVDRLVTTALSRRPPRR